MTSGGLTVQHLLPVRACADSRDLWDANVAPSGVKSDEDRREHRLAIDELHDGRPPQVLDRTKVTAAAV